MNEILIGLKNHLQNLTTKEIRIEPFDSVNTIYKVETGIKVHWFKTQRRAKKFASRHPNWIVMKIAKEGLEKEYGKKCLKMANDWDRLSII